MGSAATIHPTQLSISAIDDAIPPYPLQTGVTNHATVGAEIVPGTLKVYSNEACPITHIAFILLMLLALGILALSAR